MTDNRQWIFLTGVCKTGQKSKRTTSFHEIIVNEVVPITSITGGLLKGLMQRWFSQTFKDKGTKIRLRPEIVSKTTSSNKNVKVFSIYEIKSFVYF